MKVTLITNGKSELIGSIQGPTTQYRNVVTDRGEQVELSLGVMPMPDQKFSEVEVPDDLVRCEAHELHERLKPYLAKCK